MTVRGSARLGPARGSVEPRLGERFHLRDIVRGVPAPVWAVTALFASFLLAYAVLLPVYRAPDEPDHVDAVLDLDHGRGWPEPGKDLLDPPVVASLRQSGLSATSDIYVLNTPPHYVAAAAPPRRSRGTFDSLTETGAPRQVNQITQHPPLFYALEALALKAVHGTSWKYDKAVLFLRLLSALMVLPLPLLAHATARRLRAPPAVATTAAVLPLAVPQLTHIGSAVNNDDLLTLLVGVLTVVIACVVTGDLSRRTAVWVGVLSALALLTKGFAFVLPVWIGLSYTLALARYRRRAAVGSGLLAVLLATVLGGWWWLRNELAYGQLQPSGESTPPAPAGFVPHLSALADQWRYYLPKTFWGAFGWFDVVIPHRSIQLATAVLVLGVLLVLVGPGRLAIDRTLALATPFLGLMLLVALLSRRTYVSSGQFRGLQGRYFFPGLVGVSVLVAAGLAGPLRRLAAWLPLACALLAGAMQLYAVRAILNGYWRPVDGNASYADALHTLLAWSAWPAAPAVAALLAPVAFGLLALLVLGRSRPAPAA